MLHDGFHSLCLVNDMMPCDRLAAGAGLISVITSVGVRDPERARDAFSVTGLSLAEDGLPVVHSSCAPASLRMTFALAFPGITMTGRPGGRYKVFSLLASAPSVGRARS